MEEEIANFVAITGTSTEVAHGFLEITGGNFERAIELFYENPDLISGVNAGVSAAASQANPPAETNRNRIGREDSRGVIHIASDDDEDDEDYMQVDNDGDQDSEVERDDGTVAAAHAAAMAQEEEDAAMAKRLQEELYQQGSGPTVDGEDVRAPIARTTETLVAPEAAWGESDGAAEAAFLEQLRRRRNAPPRSGGPFGHRIWADGNPTVTGANTEGGSGVGAHARRLEELFRPPYELMSRLEWEEARTLGKEDKKWILVNLQDMSDFNCQALNRDVWKDAAVAELVSENFLFLQYDKDFPDAQEYITFYFPNRGHENPDNYPHVSIIDPRTGEQVKVWSGRPFPSAVEFHAALAEFLDRYSLAANSKNPVARTGVPKQQAVDVDRMTEEEMLEMALKNSMAASGAANGGEGSASGSTPNIIDPDSLTKESQQAEAEEEETANPFNGISSTNPHTEPENNPASTTRIQFRHSTGRVIRRFAINEPVRRIFEWLKAEPMEGKEGLLFELKQMPQGKDLIQTLDVTIEEAGLKQGTVMIEFIED